MKTIQKFAAAIIAAPLALAAAAPACAVPVVLTFEGASNGVAVNDYYNGGSDAAGVTGSDDYGIRFSAASLALVDADAGGTGNFGNEPSANTILFFMAGGAATMNVAAGFTTGFSFFYTSSATGFVNVYDGLNSTGTLLATISLASNMGGCVGDPMGSFCRFSPIGVSFLGMARSVDFGGTADLIGFDNITLGAAVPRGSAPEPATLGLLALAAAGLGAARRNSSPDAAT